MAAWLNVFQVRTERSTSVRRYEIIHKEDYGDLTLLKRFQPEL